MQKSPINPLILLPLALVYQKEVSTFLCYKNNKNILLVWKPPVCLTPVGWNSKGHLTAIGSASVGAPLLVNRWHAAEEQSRHCGQTKTDVEVNTF